MRSWVMWIWRRSCWEMGGARVFMIFVKVGRARVRKSSPRWSDVSAVHCGVRSGVGGRT